MVQIIIIIFLPLSYQSQVRSKDLSCFLLKDDAAVYMMHLHTQEARSQDIQSCSGGSSNSVTKMISAPPLSTVESVHAREGSIVHGGRLDESKPEDLTNEEDSNSMAKRELTKSLAEDLDLTMEWFLQIQYEPPQGRGDNAGGLRTSRQSKHIKEIEDSVSGWYIAGSW